MNEWQLFVTFVDVTFAPVTTRYLRAVFDASGYGEKHAGVAVQEWEALAPTEVSPPALRATKLI